MKNSFKAFSFEKLFLRLKNFEVVTTWRRIFLFLKLPSRTISEQILTAVKPMKHFAVKIMYPTLLNMVLLSLALFTKYVNFDGRFSVFCFIKTSNKYRVCRRGCCEVIPGCVGTCDTLSATDDSSVTFRKERQVPF